MRLLTQKTEFRYSFVVFCGLFFVIALLTILYWFDVVANQKWAAIISGLLTGLLVFAFQIWLSWKELKKQDAYDALKIIKILPRKDDRDDYEKLLSTARKDISVLGITAQRFLEHFANKENSRDGAKVLLVALAKGVSVRILVTSPRYLTSEKDKSKAKMAELRLKELKDEFKNNFDYAYFNHLPVHSILTIDDESIVGPVFPDVSSEFTPAIHLKNDSKFVECYLEYFKNEWAEWGNNKNIAS